MTHKRKAQPMNIDWKAQMKADDAKERGEEMEQVVDQVRDALIGRSIVRAEHLSDSARLRLTLDDGTTAVIAERYECDCSGMNFEKIILNPTKYRHAITAVTTDTTFDTWHIIAEMDDVVTIEADWAAGSQEYIVGFEVEVLSPVVEEVGEEAPLPEPLRLGDKVRLVGENVVLLRPADVFQVEEDGTPGGFFSVRETIAGADVDRFDVMLLSRNLRTGAWDERGWTTLATDASSWLRVIEKNV